MPFRSSTAACWSELLPQLLLARLGREVRRLDTADGAVDLAREPSLRLTELRIDLLCCVA
jgi:hypothetical protein